MSMPGEVAGWVEQVQGWVAPSGARSSQEKPRYDLVWPPFLERLASRLGYGARKHGDPFNYRRGVGDADFRRDRANHLIEHALKLADATTLEEREKHCAAVAANAMILDYLDHGGM